MNVKISNSYLWKGQLWFTLGEEEFYAKIKNPATGQYISDSTKESSKIFKIKNEIVTKSTDKPTNIVPLKIGKVNVNAERYEPCKFDSITIKEKEKKDDKDVETKIVVFEKGKKLINVKHPDEDIVKSILFEFDSVVIHPEGQKVLNNVLQFLLEHQHSSISLSGYACVIGKNNYNLPLSKQRADAVKKFLEDGKLDKTRIVSVGNGEAQYKNGALSVETNDNKNGEDNLKNKDEKINTHARRVDIAFKFYGHDAQTIAYETIAPSVSTKKDLEIEIIGFDTKSCFRSKGKEHKKQTKIIDIGQIADKSDVSKTFSEQKFVTKIYSDLSKFNLFPIQYIWPMATTPNKIHIHTHSCRYFSDDKNATVKVLIYPDIKWALNFFLNFTNDLSVKWQNLSPAQHKKFQEKAGKIGAERRWKQKDISFGFSLKAKWDNDKQEKELKLEYEAKLKKLYDLFSSIGALADGVTSKTKGTIRSVSAKGIPVSIAVRSPNISLTGDWFLSHPKDNKQILGTDVTIGLHAKPLIGLDITIDLLGAIVFGVSGAISGGTAAQGVTELYQQIQDVLKKGADFGNDKLGFKANVDIYMDLIISNTISLDTDFKFNTAGKAKDSKFELKAENKLKVELKVGIKIKGEAAIVIIKVKAYFEASASAEASVTFGHGINYDEKGLYYRPKLGFDGLDAKYIV